MRLAPYSYSAMDFFNAFVSGFFGCFTSFTVMENIKKAESLRDTLMWVFFTSLCFMLLSCWPLHFLLIFSMDFEDFDLYYRLDLTIYSFLAGTFLAIIGFCIAVIPFLLSLRKKYEKKYPKRDITFFEYKEKEVSFDLAYIKYIVIGGLFTGPGFMILHIIGMFSMRFQGPMDFNWDIQIVIILSGSVIAYVIYLQLFFPNHFLIKLGLAVLTDIGLTGIHAISVYFTYFYYDPSYPIPQSSLSIISVKSLGKLIIVLTYGCTNILKEWSYLWFQRNVGFIGELRILINWNQDSLNCLQRLVSSKKTAKAFSIKGLIEHAEKESVREIQEKQMKKRLKKKTTSKGSDSLRSKDSIRGNTINRKKDDVKIEVNIEENVKVKEKLIEDNSSKKKNEIVLMKQEIIHSDEEVEIEEINPPKRKKNYDK